MVRALFLDLDNTLYPASAAMESETIRRMNEYVARLLGSGVEEAAALRRERMPNYGTTLEWLMAERGFSDVEDYFSYVHPDGEEESVALDPALGPFLDSIALPKYVFTNAPMEHAARVLARLGVADRFERVFDVRFCGLRGKPAASAVDAVVAAAGVPAAESLFADDIPRYVRGFVDRGGRGVLVDHFGKHADSGLPTIRTIYELAAFL
ncbi:MAG: pyrimidine 5'-nucleotidase [Spirochaetes bacterium]|nr:pyrimidine 5'-nucleotidase [Spirochaetota bacterium]MBU1080061.1 pyrimidine 5'-nucleotidase [Spirochaetota bacterium]